ncbi:FAD-binding oxidoreductase [Pseudohongiella spirulinae]|uniref:FAD-linked oxidase n=1 Tax=Pseudohongiella spirulinae TaxID=1249552 RepID=A0A0S2KGE5_9GAMM|nr:FAD-binding oxidoreductase [Pseudohongiella spirulinae]ALO47187.1 FAD-linked oxidase [Pseudohongiella spirulinae]
MVKLESWGRLSSHSHAPVVLHDRRKVGNSVSNNIPGICYGMGRSYGDMCLNKGGNIWLTYGLNRLIAFDQETGVLRCEAGVLLRDIQQLLVPRGWMLPVTPGTELITVGGAIANDVHGKNHHIHGTFGDHVLSIHLHRTDNGVQHCTRQNQHASLRQATIGGMGLTGIIIEAELQLRKVESPWLQTESVPFRGLADFFELAEQSEVDWEHTVAWIDCLSGRQPRGIFLRANHIAMPEKTAVPSTGKSLNMPFTPPVSLVNRFSLRPFNQAYYSLNARKKGLAQAHYQSFFYPLDGIRNWNRMYGPRGFYQYQCVIPEPMAADAIQSLLDEINASGQGSFLAVLKTFADRPAAGLLSFPQAGATLALDFPDCGETTLALFDRLDQIVMQAGGRLYAAKDARMAAAMFRRGYPQLPDFLPHRDPGVSSDLSRRLLGS